LAIQLAPAQQRGPWVATAVAAYTLPGAAGAVLFSRYLGGRGGAQLAGWDAMLRAGALGAIPVAYVLGLLDLGLYVALLAASSLLHSWGIAGRYTLLAEALPQEQHLAGNAVVSTLASFATIIGPPLAGVLVEFGGAALVLAVDAATFAILAATYRFAIPPRRSIPIPSPVQAASSRTAAFRVIRRDRTLLGLLALSFGYFFLFGPVYVALPLHLAEDVRGSAGGLAAYYSAFGIGAALGALLTGYLGRWPLWPTMVGIAIAFGAAMLPLGLDVPTGVALASFGLAGFLWRRTPRRRWRCSSVRPIRHCCRRCLPLTGRSGSCRCLSALRWAARWSWLSVRAALSCSRRPAPSYSVSWPPVPSADVGRGSPGKPTCRGLRLGIRPP
jgi:MFS family permease